jgi:EAL domain-containing protein (putative c-di-GMP-specific phosphodiesterase class I)
MINELARRMDVPTVAEGVETAEQVDALREIGCDHLQGFLFARPMPAEALGEWLRGGGGPSAPSTGQDPARTATSPTPSR